MSTDHSWRGLIALLANPDSREAAARIMLGEDLGASTAQLPSAKRQRVSAALVTSGLVDPQTAMLDPGVFRAALQQQAKPPRTGIERFLDGKRIAQYPANPEQRGELLAWVAQQAFTPGEVLHEAAVNDRLRPYSEDVAVLRRYLVDHALVERSPDGAGYALTRPKDTSTS